MRRDNFDCGRRKVIDSTETPLQQYVYSCRVYLTPVPDELFNFGPCICTYPDASQIGDSCIPVRYVWDKGME